LWNNQLDSSGYCSRTHY